MTRIRTSLAGAAALTLFIATGAAAEFEHPSVLEATPLQERIARTGLLQILRADGANTSCTATALSARVVLTAAHCLQTSGARRAIHATFLPGWVDRAPADAAPGFTVTLPPLEKDAALGYAVLELATPIPGLSPLQAELRDPAAGEAVLMLSHPQAGPMRLSRRGCTADTQTPIDGQRARHHCDTASGSAGALGMADDGALLFLHEAATMDANLGIRMTLIVERSPALRAVLGGIPAGPSGD